MLFPSSRVGSWLGVYAMKQDLAGLFPLILGVGVLSFRRALASGADESQRRVFHLRLDLRFYRFGFGAVGVAFVIEGILILTGISLTNKPPAVPPPNGRWQLH